MQNNTQIWIYPDSGEAAQYSGTQPTVLNKWVHICVTIDGTAITYYYNGELVDTDTGANLSASSSASYIGFDGGSQYFNGKISDVAIYNSALSSSQIATIYNGREPYNHKEGIAVSNLVGWWRMGDGALDHRQTDGLIADQTNATLGSQLAPVFSSGWSFSASDWSESGGVATKTVGGTEQNINVDLTSGITIGKVYKVTATITRTAGNYKFTVGGYAHTGYIAETGNVTKYLIVTHASSNQYLHIHGEAAFAGTISNYSIQEVGGNAGVMINFDGSDFSGDTP